jgi:chromate transporter
MKTPESSNPTFGEAFRFWLKLGFISFGGPAGQIAIMQKELVDQKKWIAQDDFLHALNYCMLLPGPEAQQLATYIGWRLHGVKGGIAAGAFFVLPSIFFLLALSYIYAAYGNLPQISAVLEGFKAVVVAIVVEAVFKIAKRAFKSRWHIIISALAFVAIYFFQIPFPLIVLGAAVFGILLLKTKNPAANSNGVTTDDQRPQTKYRTLKIIFICFLLWLLPFLLIFLAFGSGSFAVQTYLFFTQAAFVTFGGAYAVLAYVNQAVVSAGWISAAQAVDGLALAETTPGPLIMVLQFIGFMTGWNNPNGFNQTLYAALCALLTTYVTFLPSFFFIFIGAPYIEKLRTNQNLTSALSGVTASVVGVILNLAMMFGATVLFPDSQINYFGLILAVLSFAALYFLKADVLLVVVAGGLCGLAKYLLIG